MTRSSNVLFYSVAMEQEKDFFAAVLRLAKPHTLDQYMKPPVKIWAKLRSQD